MRKLGLIAIVLGLLAMALPVHAQFSRDLDPVVVLGSEVGDFLGMSSSGLRVYAYDSGAGTWAPIPFQLDDYVIDSSSETGKKVDWAGNGLIDGVDELVFMAKDLGDMAPGVLAWPDDAESQQNTRYEIAITDPVTAETTYGYIFYSTTLATSSTSYIDYADEVVFGTSYTIGHNTDDANGLPDSLTISGNDTDILDSWRVRAHIDKLVITADFGLGPLDFVANDIYFSEDMDTEISLTAGFLTVAVRVKAFHEIDSLKIKAGPVRIIRQHTLAIRFYNDALDDTSRIPITTHYYDKSVEFRPSFSLDLGDDIKELNSDFISFSSGFNQNSTNVKFYGENTFLSGTASEDSVIDSDPTNVIFKKELSDADWPGKHWFGFTGSPQSFINNASFVTLVTLNGTRIAPNRAPALYHYDFKSDDRDPSGIYGISGLRIYDWSRNYSTTFNLDAKFRKFYLAHNSTRSEMEALFNAYSEPLQMLASKQNYPDSTPPARITDLMVSGRTDTSATLTWTAVGDDGMTNGPAQYYVIRYSTIPPADPDGNDYSWWSASTTMSVTNPPRPANPGMTEVFTIDGLEKANDYYFRINVVDDAGNASGLSNTASGTTTPVELASFNASVTNGRKVLLTWVTASETNNLGFAVERKIGQGDWNQVGFVKGAGTTAKQQNYSFMDAPDRVGEWQYRLRQVDASGKVEYTDAVAVSIAAPKQFALGQNYPNPFNPATTIAFQIPEQAEGHAVLMIYDMLGRSVRLLFDKEAEPGYYTITWDGLSDEGVQAASGLYFYTLRAGTFSETRKMIKLQ